MSFISAKVSEDSKDFEITLSGKFAIGSALIGTISFLTYKYFSDRLHVQFEERTMLKKMPVARLLGTDEDAEPIVVAKGAKEISALKRKGYAPSCALSVLRLSEKYHQAKDTRQKVIAKWIQQLDWIPEDLVPKIISKLQAYAITFPADFEWIELGVTDDFALYSYAKNIPQWVLIK
eukprot:TRINITY_DN1450_c0_g2_i2.p1 TRINITY_DN1450_c0_g2~~TRINITY_DN1450_c0_g2_i2.p1  ORF type:complete len:177 (+),score=26.42 TRINITY_DN1450_c0_g2_i2:59-589(+)